MQHLDEFDEDEHNERLRNWVWEHFPDDNLIVHEQRVEATIALEKHFNEEVLPAIIEDVVDMTIFERSMN